MVWAYGEIGSRKTTKKNLANKIERKEAVAEELKKRGLHWHDVMNLAFVYK